MIRLKMKATKESATPFKLVPTVEIVGALSANLEQYDGHILITYYLLLALQQLFRYREESDLVFKNTRV